MVSRFSGLPTTTEQSYFMEPVTTMRSRGAPMAAKRSA